MELCRRATEAGNVVAAISHGPLLVGADDLVDGRRIAVFTACREDVVTMSAHYDFGWPAMISNIITGRVPDALCGPPLRSRHRSAGVDGALN